MNRMPHSAADVIRHLMVNLSLGTLMEDNPSNPPDWTIGVSYEPDNPDNIITVYDQVGVKDGRQMFGGQSWIHYGLQVRLRSNDYPTGWKKIDSIATALDEAVDRNTVAISPNVYFVQAISRSSGPLPLGKDAPTTKRDLFTLNLTAAIRLVS